jgi:hypothetical protein
VRRFIALLAAIATLAALLVAVTASPAAAAVTTHACNPSATGWATKARWGDGTVMEARACLQYWTNNPYGVPFHRVRVEWRMRRGTTALSGTDWDLRPEYATEILTVNGALLGGDFDHADIFNTSYIATYSLWACAGSNYRGVEYYGIGLLIRATPPLLPKSNYHNYQTKFTTSPNISCD